MNTNYNCLGFVNARLNGDKVKSGGLSPTFLPGTKASFMIKLMLFVALFSIVDVGAQITIPAANTNTASIRQPFGGFFGYERSSLIFTAAEIGQPGNITTVGFYVNAVTSPSAAVNVKIYMKHRSTAVHTAAFYNTEITGATQVYGTVTIPASSFIAGQWFTVTLSTPFFYNGVDNLQILTETNATGGGNEGSTAKQFRRGPTVTGRFMTWSQDTTDPSGTLNGTVSNNRPNIQLNITAAPNCGGTPTAGTVAPLAQSICTGTTPATLVATGFTSGVSNIVFQWQESTNGGGSWGPATGGTGAATASYTPPAFLGTAILYRLQVTCTTSGLSAETAGVAVDPAASPTTQVSGAVSSLITLSGFTSTWTIGNGNRRMVVLSNNPSITDPVNGNGTALTANTVYSGSGQQIVYDNTGTAVTVTGLTCGTTYYVKIYEYTRCGGGPYDYYYNTSTGTNILTVTTGAPALVSLPVNNNFTGFTGANLSTVYPGWYESTGTAQNFNPSGSTAAWISSALGGFTTAKVNLFAVTKNDWVISPRVTLTAGSRVKFKAAITEFASTAVDASGGMQGTDDRVRVMVSTDGCGAVWTPLYTFEASNTVSLSNVLQDFNISLSAYTGQTVQIAFQASEGTVNDLPDYDFHITDIKIELAPSCESPTGLTATGITATSANVSWTAAVPTPGIGYEYAVTTSATPPTSGTFTAGTSASVSGLAPSTVHYLHVRSECIDDVDFSTWSTSAPFTTLCLPATLPVGEGFNATTTPICWSKQIVALETATGITFVTTGTNPTTSPQEGSHMVFYNSFSESNNTEERLVSGPLNTTGISSVDIAFYWRNNNNDSYDEAQYLLEGVQLQYSTNGGGSWTDIGGLIMRHDPSLALATAQWNLKSVTTTAIANLSNVLIGFKFHSGFGDNMYMDNLTISQTPTTIASFSPTTTCSQAGDTFTILGTLFTGATSVQFNGVNAASFVVNSDTSITAVAPIGVTSGYITVTTASGTGTSPTQLAVTQNPTVAPITGPSFVCLPNTNTITLSSATPTGTWSSSDVDIATINQSGVVTAVAAGDVIISYIVTDGDCSSTQTYAVSVNNPVVISSSTATQTVVTGGDTFFTVVASGTPAGDDLQLTYQWEIYTDPDPEVEEDEFYTPLSDNINYDGTDTATLLINNAPASFNGNLYHLVITGACNTATSDLAVLIVGETGIDTQPSNVTICDSGNATFTVVASEDVTAYQWQEDQGGDNWLDITNGGVYSGATTASLTLTGINQTFSGYKYRVNVTGIGSATSNSALLTVNTGITLTSQPGNAIACGGVVDSSSFAVGASGATGYQWQYSLDGVSYANVVNGTPSGFSYSGSATVTLTVNTSAAAASGTYYYKALVNGSAPCLAGESDAATLTIGNPTVLITPSSATYCLPGGSPVTLVASGAVSYSWAPAGGLSATTGDTVTAQPGTTTTYTVTGTDENGCVDTQTVVVSVGNGVAASATATPATICAGDPVQLNAYGSQAFVTPTASNYVFAASTGNALKDTAGSIQLLGSGQDITASGLANIGFTFNFGGTNYTQFSASSNGAMRLGAALVTSADGNDLTSFPYINPMWDDMHTCTNGSVSYKLDATAGIGNRILIVEWKYGTYGERAGTFTKTVQVLLNEGTNQVRFIYGPNTGVALTSASVGIVSSGTAYNSVSTATSSSSTTARNNANTVWPTAGTAYSFTANNAPTFTYSWTSDPAGFTSTLGSPVVNPTANTTYNVVVTSPSGCSGSASTSVTLQSGAAIQTSPADVTQCQGGTAVFNVVATGPGLTYQWRKDGVDIVGNSSATTATLSIVGTTPANNGVYDVIVTPGCGAAITSDAADLLVNPTPTATSPGAQNYCAGVATAPITISGTPSGVTFNITGGAAVGLANQSNVTVIPSFTPVAGTATVTITPSANGCPGTAVTYAIVVNPAPATPTLGANTPVCEGGTLNLTSSTVPATGFSMNANSGVAFIDIDASGASIGTVGDDTEHNITMPSFTYNGISYTTARIGMNGLIVLGSIAGEVSLTNAVLPSTSNTAGNIFLAPYWDDLDINMGATVKTQTVGSNFIIQWTNTDHNAFTTGNITFQVQMNLTTGVISYVYPDVIFGSATYDAGLTATIGLQMSSTSAVQYSFNTASLTNGQSITFTPNNSTYAWTGPNSFTSSVQNPSIPSVTEAAEGTYTVVVSHASGCQSTASIPVVVNQNVTYYTDADGDGYGSTTSAAVVSCTGPPANSSTNNTDCNDAVFAINPGAPEVLYDGVDNNCNNQLDEGNQITTSLLSSVCNTTLTSIGSLIGITTIAPGSAYTAWRIRVTNGAQVQIITRNVPHFTLPMLPSYDYATTYTVEIELQRNGVWLGYYGPACSISSPAILAENGATQVSPSQCGITLARINTLIATTSLQGVTGYRFKVTNITEGASGPNVIQTIDRTQHWFSLPMLTQYNYGSTYRIEVAVKTNGVYSGFGAPCEVSSPASPTLINCGGVVAAQGTLIAATSVQGATQYRFQVTRMSDNATTTIDRNANSFSFAMVPGYTPAAQYAVRVAVMTVGTWSPFGDACEITSPGSAARFIAATEATSSDMFKATAYPNPFASTFAIDVTSSAQANVQIMVYDMTGRLIETREVKTSDMNTLQVGDRYPSGVYNVIVTQDGNVETLRVIKR